MATNTYLSEVLADEPIAYWPLSEFDGSAVDRSGNNRVITAGPNTVRSRSGVSFAGPEASLTTDIYMNHSKFTIEFWLATEAESAALVTARGSSGRSLAAFMGTAPVYGADPGVISVGITGDGVWTGARTVNKFNDGVKHHVVLIYDATIAGDGNEFKVVVDGVQQTLENIHYSGPGSLPVVSNASYVLGRPQEQDNYGGVLSGLMSRVAFYGKALTLERAQAHYRIAMRDGARPVLSDSEEGWRYLQIEQDDSVDRSAVDFDDSSWSIGASPFASGPRGSWATPQTHWSIGTSLWMRRTIKTLPGIGMHLRIWIDNQAQVYFNGNLIADFGSQLWAGAGWFGIPGSMVLGSNVLAVRAWDDNRAGYAYVTLQVTADDPPTTYRANPSDSPGASWFMADLSFQSEDYEEPLRVGPPFFGPSN